MPATAARIELVTEQVRVDISIIKDVRKGARESEISSHFLDEIVASTEAARQLGLFKENRNLPHGSKL